jgi:hypothetical protein
MKKYLLFILCIAFSSSIFAQGVPQGIPFQGVARDLNGTPIAEKEIKIRINLLSADADGQILYQEFHKVTTNQLGLFDLVVGQGRATEAEFNTIPWSSQDIWMELSINDQKEGDNYQVLSNSQLLSVPYALHSGTANELTSNYPQSSTGPYWKTTGNINSFPQFHFIGTVDAKDFNIRTANQTRMTIEAGGDVDIVNSVDVGQNAFLNTSGGQTINFGDFTSQQNVTLNTVGGQTINQGDFTSEQNVDLNTEGGETNVFGDLTAQRNVTLNTVDGQTINQGDLTSEQNVTLNTIGGVTDINGNVRVLNQSSTELSGLLDVDGTTRLKQSLTVYGPTNLESSLNVNQESPTVLSGTLNVEMDAVMDSSLNVGKTFIVDGPSINPDDANNPLDQDKFAVAFDQASFGVPVAFNSDVSFKSPVSISADPDSIKSTALSVTAFVDRSSTEVNPTTTPATHVAHFENLANGNGISIKVGSTEPHNWNNFITFLNSSGATVGRIEGEDSDCDAQCQEELAKAGINTNPNVNTVLDGFGLTSIASYLTDLGVSINYNFGNSGDFSRNQEYVDDVTFATLDVAQATIAEIFAIADAAVSTTEVISVSADVRACAGLGACVTTPGAVRIVTKGAVAIIEAADIITSTLDLAQNIAAVSVLRSTHKTLEGITFASGSEDYAEYLPRLNQAQDLLPGQLVGMKNGFVTLDTRDADRIMVISHNPAVLGGIPQEGDEREHEMVAFLGQIPTMVMGKVEPGDYILPSGWNNGYGVAKNPKDMTPEDYKLILGVAWESNERGMGEVNVAVGLNTNDVADQLIRQQEEIDRLNEQMNILAELVPGFKEAAGLEDKPASVIASTGYEVELNQDQLDFDNSQNTVEQTPVIQDDKITFEPVENGEIIYYEITQEHLDASYTLAKHIATNSGVDLKTHPFWTRVENDPAFKKQIMTALKKELTNSFQKHKEINDKFMDK